MNNYTVKFNDDAFAPYSAVISVLSIECVHVSTDIAYSTTSINAIPQIKFDDDVPESFWIGLADINYNRVVDIDTAHNEKP